MIGFICDGLGAAAGTWLLLLLQAIIGKDTLACVVDMGIWGIVVVLAVIWGAIIMLLVWAAEIVGNGAVIDQPGTSFWEAWSLSTSSLLGAIWINRLGSCMLRVRSSAKVPRTSRKYDNSEGMGGRSEPIGPQQWAGTAPIARCRLLWWPIQILVGVDLSFELGFWSQAQFTRWDSDGASLVATMFLGPASVSSKHTLQKYFLDSESAPGRLRGNERFNLKRIKNYKTHRHRL